MSSITSSTTSPNVVDSDPVDASIDPSGGTLSRSPRSPASRSRRTSCATTSSRPSTTRSSASSRPTVEKVKPEVTTAEVAEKYPTYIVVDRSNFTLTLYENLKLTEEYTVAIGAAGFDTPVGEYAIQNKQVDPVWNVPDSDWAGSLAGTTVPPGPDNPLKARWMGIYDGAGIHGTDDVGSLGSAASHGCVRMAVDDVIDLYDQVDVGTPIYIG